MSMKLNKQTISIEITDAEVFFSRVTLNEGQGHLDKYQNVKFSSIQHHIKFVPHRFINL